MEPFKSHHHQRIQTHRVLFLSCLVLIKQNLYHQKHQAQCQFTKLLLVQIQMSLGQHWSDVQLIKRLVPVITGHTGL